MLIERESEELSFSQLALSRKEHRWNRHWLKKILNLVDWSKFDKLLKKPYSKKDGRHAWEPLFLFKCLLLQQWYGMSDRQLEEALEFRIDFCKFAGFNFEDNVPDATTFVKFRNRIKPVWNKLLIILNKQIEQAGFQIKKAVAVDATLVEAHSKPCGNKASLDSDGSWRGFPAKKVKDKNGDTVLARRQALFGYKINLSATVKHGFVSDFSICKASEHETHHLEEFIDRNKTRVVYADKGYVGNRSLLSELKIADGIQAKGSRGKPLLDNDISRNKKITKSRRIVEGVFGGFKQWYGWRKTKYVGLSRNSLAVCLTALAWNMKKLALITG